MRIKRSLKVVALVLAVLVSFPSAALAALPSNTIVFGTKAYDLSLLDDASVANEILAAFVANGNLFAYKMPAGNFIDPNAQAIDPATLPAVTYVDAAKVSTNYQAGDGDVVPTAVTLTGVTATNGTITPTFEAAVTGATLADFTVTATKDGTAYTLAGLTFDAATNTFTFTAVAAGEATQSLVITVAAAATSTKVSGTATVTVTVTATDIVAPAIAEDASEFVDYQTLKVTFTEEVVESEAGLVVTSNDVEVDAVLADDGMSLTIVDEDGFAAGVYTVVVNGLEDLAGNAMAEDATVEVTKDVSYIAEFEIETTTIPDDTAGDVVFYYTAEDQYGEPFTTADELADFVDAFSATARVGGFPLPGVTVGTDVDAGKITLGADEALKEGAVVTATLKNTVEDVVVATLVHELTVVGEPAEATYIKSLEVDPEAVLVADETMVEITIEVLDQFFRPMDAPSVRWETSDKTVVAFTGDPNTVHDGGLVVEVDFLKAGSATITAYLVDNIAVSESIALNIGATRLAGITVPAFAEPAGYNHEEIQSDPVDYTEGAILTPDMLKFDITGMPEDATEGDINITADYDDDDIVLTVVTAVAGTYKFKAFVGDDEDAIVSEEVTVVTTINPEVAAIDDIVFAENELTVGGIVGKDLVFRNEHGEAVDVATVDLVLAFLADKVAVVKVLDTEDVNVVGLGFTGLVVGNWTVTLSTGDVVKEIAVPVVEAAAVESISIAATVTVIKADVYDDVEDETIFFDGDQAYKIMPVVFYNQYGNAMDVNDDDLVETPVGVNLEFVELMDDGEGGYAVAGGDVVAIGVHATGDAGEEETFILEVDELDSAEVTVTVLDAREANGIEIDEFATSLLLDAEVTIEVIDNIDVLDQYGVPFVLTDKLGADVGDYQVLADSTDEDVIGVTYAAVEGQSDITLTAVGSGSATVTISLYRVGDEENVLIDSAEYLMTGSSQDEIARLEISAPFDVLILGGNDTVYVEDRTTVTLVVKAYDKDDKEIAVSLEDFDWSTSDVTKATVVDGVVTAVADAADGEATIKAVSLGGTEATIVITVSDEMALASVAFADDTPNEVEEVSTIELMKADIGGEYLYLRFFDENGYEILRDDAVLNANFGVIAIAYRWTSTNEAVASVDAGTGVVTGAAVGTATIRVMLQDGGTDLGIYATIKISVTE